MVVLCALVAGAGMERPQDDQTRRGVARFDFEESEFNPDPVPQFWFRAQDDPAVPRSRPGFPRFNEAVFDHATAAGGTSSVRLPTQGGSTSLRLMPGTIPVFPDADYSVTAKVRTRGLMHARAALTARLLREDRTPVPGSERRSELVIAEEGWRGVSIEIATDRDGAAFLQLDLELLQASRFAAERDPAPGRIAFEDIGGEAWFDDVAVDLIPRAGLRTLSPGNLISAEQRPVLEFRIRDLVAQQLTARVHVRDPDGKSVASHTTGVSSDGRATTWTPELPGFGAFRAELEVLHRDRVIERRETAFVWSSAPGRTLGPVGLEVEAPEGADPGWEGFVPAAIRATGAGAVWMAMPTTGSPAVATVEQTLASGVELTLMIPEEIARAASELSAAKGADGATTPEGPPSARATALMESLDRFGQRVTRWGLRGAADETMRGLLRRFVPGPVVSSVREVGRPEGVDWSDALVLRVPASIAAEEIPDAVSGWLGETGGAPVGGVTLVLETVAPSTAGDRAAANDFVRRAVHAWRLLGSHDRSAALTSVMLVVSPAWTPARTRSGRVGGPEPTPQVGVLSTIGARLHNRRVVGEFAVAPGVTCYVLANVDPQSEADAAEGCLVAWSDAGAGAVLEGYLGPNPARIVDAFGNERPAPKDESGTYLRVPIGPDPVFIEPIDPALARLVSGFRVEPGAAPAVIAAHEHELVLDNPWPVPMGGELRILSPSSKERWDVSPSSVQVSAPAGGQARIPITLSFPPDQETGSTPIVAIIELRSPVSTPPIRVSAPLMIGLLDLEFTGAAERGPGPGGPDVVITVSIANNGSRERTLRLDAASPGRATAQYSISNLAPGERTVRRFVFQGAAAQLSGKRVRLSLTDVETPERLNRVVQVP